MKSKLNTKLLVSITGLSATVWSLLPSYALAAVNPFGIAYIGTLIIDTINLVLVPLLFAIAFITFLYGVAKTYIFSYGDEEAVKQGHKLILWGLIGFVVMVSLWGFVNVVGETFGLYGEPVPDFPQTPTTPN